MSGTVVSVSGASAPRLVTVRDRTVLPPAASAAAFAAAEAVRTRRVESVERPAGPRSPAADDVARESDPVSAPESAVAVPQPM